MSLVPAIIVRSVGDMLIGCLCCYFAADVVKSKRLSLVVAYGLYAVIILLTWGWKLGD